MTRRIYQYLKFACRLGYLLPMIVLAIILVVILAMSSGEIINPDEWKNAPRVIRWPVTASWVAFFWFSIWVVFIEPVLSSVMADVLKGILCCALIACGVATIVRWLIGLRLTERIRASARLDAMVRRNHGP
jgi:fucose 4-O-acetylase-like acetyltransferase